MEIVEELASNHNEAETRLLLQSRHASQNAKRLIINSPDTDMLVLCAAHYTELGCNELWFCSGVSDKIRYIPVHDICHTIGELMCKAIPAFHAITGCDSTSSIDGIGKAKAWEVLRKSSEHQQNLANFGESLELNPTAEEEAESLCARYILFGNHTHSLIDIWKFYVR